MVRASTATIHTLEEIKAQVENLLELLGTEESANDIDGIHDLKNVFTKFEDLSWKFRLELRQNTETFIENLQWRLQYHRRQRQNGTASSESEYTRRPLLQSVHIRNSGGGEQCYRTCVWKQQLSLKHCYRACRPCIDCVRRCQ